MSGRASLPSARARAEVQRSRQSPRHATACALSAARGIRHRHMPGSPLEAGRPTAVSVCPVATPQQNDPRSASVTGPGGTCAAPVLGSFGVDVPATVASPPTPRSPTVTCRRTAPQRQRPTSRTVEDPDTFGRSNPPRLQRRSSEADHHLHTYGHQARECQHVTALTAEGCKVAAEEPGTLTYDWHYSEEQGCLVLLERTRTPMLTSPTSRPMAMASS